jgi:hypothetical protein
MHFCIPLARTLYIFVSVYYSKLFVEAKTSQQVLAELLDTLKLRLTRIHDTVRFRTAIPTTQVYVCYLHSLYWISIVMFCRAGLHKVSRNLGVTSKF